MAEVWKHVPAGSDCTVAIVPTDGAPWLGAMCVLVPGSSLIAVCSDVSLHCRAAEATLISSTAMESTCDAHKTAVPYASDHSISALTFVF